MDAEVQTALDECRAAFAANQDAKSAWCCHHEKLWEVLTEPYEKRIAYILSEKPKSEHLLRFQNFRPCSQHDKFLAINAKRQPELHAIYAKWQTELDAINAKWQPELDAINAKRQPELDAIYKTDVPKGTWNGTSIFK
jgi:hypothetical protein